MNQVPDFVQPYDEFYEIQDRGKKKKFTDFNGLRKTLDEVSDKKIALKNCEKH